MNPDAGGEKGSPAKRSWNSKDALLYPIGVGARVDELAFATENTRDTFQRVLPTMAVVIGMGGVPCTPCREQADKGDADGDDMKRHRDRLTARPHAILGQSVPIESGTLLFSTLLNKAETKKNSFETPVTPCSMMSSEPQVLP